MPAAQEPATVSGAPILRATFPFGAYGLRDGIATASPQALRR